MARGRSSGYDDQRELILGHAAALFARSGYPGTSMNEVAQACGLSKPTIYHYFRDKFALLVDITLLHQPQHHRADCLRHGLSLVRSTRASDRHGGAADAAAPCSALVPGSHPAASREASRAR